MDQMRSEDTLLRAGADILTGVIDDEDELSRSDQERREEGQKGRDSVHQPKQNIPKPQCVGSLSYLLAV